MPRRSHIRVSPCAMRSWRYAYRSSRCTSRTCSRASRRGTIHCWRIWPWAWCAGSEPRATAWDSRGSSAISAPAVGADRRHARQHALVGLFEAEGLDAVLVTGRANIRYVTGFSGSAALVVVTRHDVLLVTDFRYDAQARAEAGDVARVVVERTSVWDRLFRELPAL